MTRKTATVQTNEAIAEFDIDPELLGQEFNSPRIPRFTYGIVINDNPAGLFIPEKNLTKAGWIGTPETAEITLAGGIEKGILFTKARFIVLGAIEPYVRYKPEQNLKKEGVDTTMALTAIGWYEEEKDLLDKKIMDVASEHLIMFLDDNNEFLHQRPIRIRFKNVALWSIKETLDEVYTAAELTFAKISKTKASGKSDRWRSLCIINAEFKGVKEGEGSNKSYCCKVANVEQPTVQNFASLFLGSKDKKSAVWEIFDMNSGFMLTGMPINSTKQIEAAQELPMLNGK